MYGGPDHGSRSAASTTARSRGVADCCRALLQQLVAGRGPAVAELVEQRGTSALLPRSHLEQACMDV